jgi:hypothetical protein
MVKVDYERRRQRDFQKEKKEHVAYSTAFDASYVTKPSKSRVTRIDFGRIEFDIIDFG